MTGYGWHDSLLWSIRPDCRIDAQQMLDRIQAHNTSALTPDAAGLHMDNLWKSITKSWAKAFDLDELPIDMMEGGIAVVSVIGPLVNFENPFTANYPLLIAAFDYCRENAAVKAVIVRFKTPGGTVSGLAECAAALDQLSNEKLTVAQVDGGCYSAGYFLACHCGAICCGATDHIGNIGTVTTIYDFSKYFESEGVRTVVFKTGPIKGVGIPGSIVTDVQEMFLQEMTDAHFAHFKTAVMNGRNMDEPQFAAVSDGRWWLGEQAVDNGVIDRVLTMKETVSLIRQQLAA